jgi:hypothetical protein
MLKTQVPEIGRFHVITWEPVDNSKLVTRLGPERAGELRGHALGFMFRRTGGSRSSGPKRHESSVRTVVQLAPCGRTPRNYPRPQARSNIDARTFGLRPKVRK